MLVVPASSVAASWSRIREKHRPVLEVLLALPVTVVDDLDATRARAVGGLGRHRLDAHALLCAQDRGWPLVTGIATDYVGSDLDGVEIEQLP